MSGTRILYIPDLQVEPGKPLRHLTWAAKYIAAKQFPIVVQGGDWCDWASLSSYDKGKKSAEGKRVSKDWDAFRRSVDLIEAGFKRYKPRKVFTKGNHDQRADRYAEDNPAIDCLPDVSGYLSERGWECHDFLKIARIEGIHFSHLFPRSMTGRVSKSGLRFGAPSAHAQIRANMASCVAGHRPGYEHAVYNAGERRLHGIIAGSFYLDQKAYLGPGGDNQWRGLVVLNGVHRGEFDPMPVRMNFLKERFSK